MISGIVVQNKALDYIPYKRLNSNFNFVLREFRMNGMSIKKVQTDVLILSAICAGIAILYVILNPRFNPKSIIFLVICFLLISVHWWLLGNLVSSIFSKDRLITIVMALFAFFPLALGIALCYVAGKIDRSFVIPAGFGMFTVPISVTVYCLFYGLLGQTQFFRLKGSIYGKDS